MQNNYNGMTVNERLYESGRMEEFDSAVEGKNETQLRSILQELGVDQPSIDAIVNKTIKTKSDNKPLPRSIRYPLILFLAAVGFIGVLVMLYDRGYIPLVGPAAAIVVASVIVFLVRWRRS